MSDPSGAIDDCWNRIGVNGDRTCGRLHEHGHCCRCEVHGNAAARMMRREAPPEYLAAWTEHFSAPEQALQATSEAVLVFRVESEWLALPARDAVLVADSGKPHRLPHRDGNGLAGIVNVRGRLYPCISLASFLQITRDGEDAAAGHCAGARIVVVRLGGMEFALPVQEVHGIHRYREDQLQPVPSTLSREAHRCIRGVLHIGSMTAGCLDAGFLGQQLASLLK